MLPLLWAPSPLHLSSPHLSVPPPGLEARGLREDWEEVARCLWVRELCVRQRGNGKGCPLAAGGQRMLGCGWVEVRVPRLVGTGPWR